MTSRSKARPMKDDDYVTIKTFFMKDRPGGRELVERTVIVSMRRFICALPGVYSYGYGDERTVSLHPTTIEFPYAVPAGEWVELHFEGSVYLNMYASDFRDTFGREPPRQTN